MARSNARFAFPNKFLQWEKIFRPCTDLQSLEELVALLDAAYIFSGVFDISPRSWSCDITKMCYIFRQIFPFHSDKICDFVTSPSHCFFDTCHFFGGTWPAWTGVFLLPPPLGTWKNLGTRLRLSDIDLVTCVACCSIHHILAYTDNYFNLVCFLISLYPYSLYKSVISCTVSSTKYD